MRRVGASLVLDADPALVPAALARAGDALDLRTLAPYDPGWAERGFTPVAGDELARPVPQELPDVAATEALGRRLGGLLQVGDLLVLTGPLGAGKTALTRGIGAALGVSGAVTSPTFVLARRHRGPLPLLHVDAYRLRGAGGGPEVLEDLDLEAGLEEGVVVVEWGEGLVEDVADARLEVVLDRGGTGGRVATVRARGARWRVTGGPPGRS